MDESHGDQRRWTWSWGRRRREPGGRPEPSGPRSSTAPDPEVPAKAQRRRFTAAYRLRILKRRTRASGLASWGRCCAEKACIARERTGDGSGSRAPCGTCGDGPDPTSGRPACEAVGSREPQARAEAAAGRDDHRPPKKSCRDRGDPPETPRHRRDRLMRAIEAVTAKGETSALCQSIGVSRASLYRRRRPTPPATTRRPRAPSPRALVAAERRAVPTRCTARGLSINRPPKSMRRCESRPTSAPRARCIGCSPRPTKCGSPRPSAASGVRQTRDRSGPGTSPS